MKKIIGITLAIVILLSFASCDATLSVEDYEWTLRYAITSSGTVAANEPSAAHPDAAVVDIKLTASNGILTINDATNGETYTGTYLLERRTPGGADYSVTIDGISGHMTIGMTTYLDGTEEPTLPINLGEYSLYFYSPQN